MCVPLDLLSVLNEEQKVFLKNIEKLSQATTCPYIVAKQLQEVRDLYNSFSGYPWEKAMLIGYYHALRYRFIRVLMYKLKEQYANQAYQEIENLRVLVSGVPEFYPKHPIWLLFDQVTFASEVLSVFTKKLTNAKELSQT